MWYNFMISVYHLQSSQLPPVISGKVNKDSHILQHWQTALKSQWLKTQRFFLLHIHCGLAGSPLIPVPHALRTLSQSTGPQLLRACLSLHHPRHANQPTTHHSTAMTMLPVPAFPCLRPGLPLTGTPSPASHPPSRFLPVPKALSALKTESNVCVCASA